MILSLYDITVPTLVGGLNSLQGVLDKAVAHVEAKKLDPRALLDARLYPDMFAFQRQVQVVADLARRGVDRLAGVEPASVPDEETTFTELSARLASTLDHVKGADRAAIDASVDREFTVNVGQTMTFTGRSYLLGFLLPNFLFHVTTAYDILRHNGVELGKRGFIAPFVMAGMGAGR
ncbi:DUF1993 domain-containing protein [Haliangium sp.]|uniref:DUF1993 domain-containing protein n=1 Tax=Haliangium sp. TaxID=2663208 RepID=UPI003D0CF164